MIKLGISFAPTHFDERRCRIACLTSETEVEGKFKKIRKSKISVVWNIDRRGRFNKKFWEELIACFP
jgi:hypothetical protein